MGIPAHVPTLTSKYIISTTGLYSTTTVDVTWFVCAVLTQNQRRAATNESRRAKVLLHGRVAAVRHHELQWEIIFSRNMPYEFQKVCLLVAPGKPLGISFASLSIVGECWICRLLQWSYWQMFLITTRTTRDTMGYLSSSVSSRAWNCSRKALNLGMLQQPMEPVIPMISYDLSPV